MTYTEKLLVITDTQVDFLTGSLGTEDADVIVDNIVQKINEWDGYLIATADIHDSDYLNTREGRYLPILHTINGTDGAEIHPAIMTALRNKGNAFLGVVEKSTFGSTILPFRIKAIEELIGIKFYYIEFTGRCTAICVVSNALIVKAFFPEVDMAVDAKCCSCVSKETHEAALLTMKTCQIDILNWKND